jgi:hypothetical protein
MIDLIDMSPAAQDEGIPVGRKEMCELFGDFDPSEHEDEVKDLWGETDAYGESARRTRRYAKEDLARFTAASDAVVDARFYPCSQEMHAHLGQMYVADPRFAATCERIHPGLAQYVRDAIIANAARAAGEPG